MDKEKAEKVLTKVIKNYRLKSYDELSELIDNSKWIIEKGNGRAEYQIQIQVFVDDEKTGNVRCIVSIDNGGIFSFMTPLSDDFIKNAKNEFIGE